VQNHGYCTKIQANSSGMPSLIGSVFRTYLKGGREERPGEFMFTGRREPGRSMTTRQYARLVSEWITNIGLDDALAIAEQVDV